MPQSNIVAGSNVFLVRTEDPRHDPDFVAQILDCDLLEQIYDRKKFDSEVPSFSSVQKHLVSKGARCPFAQNDPCIGPVEGKGIQTKCINTKCPGIYDRASFYGTSPWKGCNPSVTQEYIDQWTPNKEENELYGKPEKLVRFFRVDMISDEEMSQYVSDPGNDGVDHPTPPAPVYNNSEPEMKSPPFIIDPKTGRKMVVIGFEKLKYPEEDGLPDPIYGYADEDKKYEMDPIMGFVDSLGNGNSILNIRKAKLIEKKNEKIKKKPIESISDSSQVNDDYKRKAEFEKEVSSNISSEIKLTEIEGDTFDLENTVILVDNPAEMAFVSNTLLVSCIEHSMKFDYGIKIALIDDYIKYTDKECLLISSTVLNRGCKTSNVQAWKELSTRKSIIRLKMADRDYYEFKYDKYSRWTCRNAYGVTHVCVNEDDIDTVDGLGDGLYSVSLVDDGDSYMILKKNGEPLGHLGINFVNLINELKEKDEITATPQVIKGLALKVNGGIVEIIGMGHLKFIEY